MKYKFKEMICNVHELQKGDIILSHLKGDCYVIEDVGISWLHQHKYYEVKYILNDTYKKWFADYMYKTNPTRKIIRLVEDKK